MLPILLLSIAQYITESSLFNTQGGLGPHSRLEIGTPNSPIQVGDLLRER